MEENNAVVNKHNTTLLNAYKYATESLNFIPAKTQFIDYPISLVSEIGVCNNLNGSPLHNAAAFPLNLTVQIISQIVSKCALV